MNRYIIGTAFAESANQIPVSDEEKEGLIEYEKGI